MKRKVKVFKGNDDLWYFVIIGDNGETIGLSEAYTRKDDALDTIEEYYPGWTITGADDKVIERGD